LFSIALNPNAEGIECPIKENPKPPINQRAKLIATAKRMAEFIFARLFPLLNEKFR
jgi:hypothetical protein